MFASAINFDFHFALIGGTVLQVILHESPLNFARALP